MQSTPTFRIGTRVRTRMEFSRVPRGTEGIVDEDYGSGLMVAWDLPGCPLPPGYCRFDGRPPATTGILRDGFDKQHELHFLETVRSCPSQGD